MINQNEVQAILAHIKDFPQKKKKPIRWSFLSLPSKTMIISNLLLLILGLFTYLLKQYSPYTFKITARWFFPAFMLLIYAYPIVYLITCIKPLKNPFKTTISEIENNIQYEFQFIQILMQYKEYNLQYVIEKLEQYYKNISYKVQSLIGEKIGFFPELITFSIAFLTLYQNYTKQFFLPDSCMQLIWCIAAVIFGIQLGTVIHVNNVMRSNVCIFLLKQTIVYKNKNSVVNKDQGKRTLMGSSLDI